MLTKPQQEMFDKIAKKELTAKQKGDFYFRMSKILKKRLDELDTISYLINIIPNTYLSTDKIDFMKAAVHAMDVTERLVEKLDPAFVSPILKDSHGNDCDYQYSTIKSERPERVGSRIIRHYRVDIKSYFQGLTDGTAIFKVSYEPSKKEIDFLDRLTHHQSKLDEIRHESEHRSRIVTNSEFKDIILSQLKKRGKNFEAKAEFAVGLPKPEASAKEAIYQFNKAEKTALK